MTPASLESRTKKDLTQLARERGVPGWHSMRKEQLIRALLSATRRKTGTKKSGARAATGTGSRTRKSIAARKANRNGKVTSSTNGAGSHKSQESIVQRRLEDLRRQQEQWKDLSHASSHQNGNGSVKRDRLVVMVRDPFWLHAYWEVSRQSVERAAAALGHGWHSARPVIRIYEVHHESGQTDSEKLVGNVDIHGGVNHWFVDVRNPPGTYRLDIGYLDENDKYYSLARSNVVSTPAAGQKDVLEGHWEAVAKDCDAIYARSSGHTDQGPSRELQELLEERLGRPMGAPQRTRFGTGAEDPRRLENNLDFHVDAECIIFGSVHPDAYVTLQGEPLRLRPDGTFTIRMSMPDRRQVIPVVAQSQDGVEQRTIVLALERNTKFMEPVIKEIHEE